MSARPKQRHSAYNKANKEQDRMADKLDRLAEFEAFQEKWLPAIRADLEAGMTPKQLRQKYASLAQAAEIMDLLNPDKRASAAKNILDREEGKAKETVVNEHRFKNMKPEQIDALLMSKLGIAETKDDKKTNH